METKNIKCLITQALELCREQRFTESSIASKRKIFGTLFRMHENCGISAYDDGVVTDYVNTQRERYCNGEIKKDTCNFKVKTALQLKELFETGTIDYGRVNRESNMMEYYSEIVDQMLSFPEWDEKYAHGIRRYAMPFFKWLAAKQIYTLDGINESIIRLYMLDASIRLKLNSIHHINGGLKKLFYFLKTKGSVEEDFSHVFSLPLPQEHRIRKPISHDEIASVLKSIDQSAPQGKRDYAMILIGTVTGLRSVDIRELKFENLDWINGEIRISQAKTGKALALPLTKDIGEALKNYITGGRPNIDSEYVFLRTYAPHLKLTDSVLYNSFNKYRFALGLPRCGIHGLRRALGTSLVTTGIPVTTVAQILGHRNLESTKQYISLDTVHLRDVGLNLEGFMPEKEGDNHDI